MQTACRTIFKGIGRVAISRGTRGFAGGFVKYAPLAPSDKARAFIRDHDDPWSDAAWAGFSRIYNAQLKKLNAQNVWDKLHAAAKGAEPVLLCYEKPDEQHRCHRRLVAIWFKKELGKDVPEMPVAMQQASG